MQSIQKIGFHESSLVASSHIEETIILKLEDVHVADDRRNISIRLDGVRGILCDGVEVNKFAAECEDAEVLTLEYSNNSLYLIVECMDFKRHTNHVRSYRIACDSVQLEIH
jgi:hypothetical protein